VAREYQEQLWQQQAVGEQINRLRAKQADIDASIRLLKNQVVITKVENITRRCNVRKRGFTKEDDEE